MTNISRKKIFLLLLFVTLNCNMFSVGFFDSQFNYWEIFENLKAKDRKILLNLQNHFSKLTDQGFFEKTIERNTIPKVIHFIWIGPKHFPEDSKKNIISWIENNPGYVFKFWTDRKRDNLPKNLTIHFINASFFHFFLNEYLQSENYGEKSDLIRYEILFREGGVYVDHDVVAYNSLDTLLERVDFFCGVEPPHIPLGESSITICNNIIGSKSKHPIIEETIFSIKKDWDSIGSTYVGNSRDMITKRVFFRTFLPFSNSVFELLESKKFINLVLPPIFFNDIYGNKGIFAHHEYASSWFNSLGEEEKFFKKRLEKISKKTNKLLLGLSILLLMNFTFLFFVLVNRLIRKKKYVS